MRLGISGSPKCIHLSLIHPQIPSTSKFTGAGPVFPGEMVQSIRKTLSGLQVFIRNYQARFPWLKERAKAQRAHRTT